MDRRDRSRERAIAVAIERPRSLASDAWEHLGGWRGLALRLALVLLFVAAAEQHVLRGSSLVVLLIVVASGVPLAGRAALPMAGYAASWSAFALIRAKADDIGFSDRGAAVASIDRVLGGGITPTEHLQRALYQPGVTSFIETSAMAVHWSYYVVPHALALLLWWRSRDPETPDRFTPYLRATIGIMSLGLLLYIMTPTSPPWLQATRDDEVLVYRIAHITNSGYVRNPEQVYTFFSDPNPIAAMPSLHTAFTVMVACFLWRERRLLGALGIAYALAMGASLVYLGEHYIVDVAAGTVMAMAVVLLVARPAPRVEQQDERRPATAPRVAERWPAVR